MDSACDARRGVFGNLRMIRIRIVAREHRPAGRRQGYRRRRNGYPGRRGDRGHWHGARGAARQDASRARRAGRRRPRASFRRRRGGRRRRAGARILRTAGGEDARQQGSSRHDNRHDSNPPTRQSWLHATPPPLRSVLIVISVSNQSFRIRAQSAIIPVPGVFAQHPFLRCARSSRRTVLLYWAFFSIFCLVTPSSVPSRSHSMHSR